MKDSLKVAVIWENGVSSNPFVKHWKDIGFVAVAGNIDEFVVDYEIYDVEGWEDDGSPLFHKKDSEVYPDPVELLSDAEPFITGGIKWDGCSNWYFEENLKGMMIHACTRKDLSRLGEVLIRCWDWTADLCPKFKENSDDVRSQILALKILDSASIRDKNIFKSVFDNVTCIISRDNEDEDWFIEVRQVEAGYTSWSWEDSAKKPLEAAIVEAIQRVKLV